MFVVDVIAVLLVIVGIGMIANGHKAKVLRRAPKGAVRVETIKQSHLGNTLAQYQRYGWQVEQQSSAKSLGSQARITVTMRKAA